MPENALMDWARQAQGWAAEAGDIALAGFGRSGVRRKADGTEVTDADVAVQTMLAERIARLWPDHAVIGEEILSGPEAGPLAGRARFCWVIDPIDGTRNYARGFPVFATALALLDGGRPVLGVIRWHHAAQTFTALAGQGATLNGSALRVSQQPMDPNTLIGAQLGSNHRTGNIVAPWLDRWAVRNIGATSLHLALIASGSLAAAYAKDAAIWDLAAGALLVTEAGGHFTNTAGRPIFPVDHAICARANYPFIAGSPAGHAALLEDLRSRA